MRPKMAEDIVDELKARGDALSLRAARYIEIKRTTCRLLSSRVAIAVEFLDAQYGHQTAHLTPPEQIEVAHELTRRLTRVVAEIIDENFVEAEEQL